VRVHFRPEFLNRIDDIIIFDRLTHEDLRKIVDIQLARVMKRLADRRIELEISDEVKDFLGNEGYDPVYGARPLKRVIQDRLLNPLSLEVLEGNVKDGDTVKAVMKDGLPGFQHG